MSTNSLTPQQIYRKQSSGEAVFDTQADAAGRHVITVKLENTVGALNRVANLFSQRGFQLESVSVGETSDPSVARMTLVTSGTNRIVAQVLRQLNNLVDTLEIDDVTDGDYVERELCLLRVAYTLDNRAAMLDTINIFRGKVVNITPDSMTFELTGPTNKINAFIGLMGDSYTIQEVVRSGRVAMRRNLAFED